MNYQFRIAIQNATMVEESTECQACQQSPEMVLIATLRLVGGTLQNSIREWCGNFRIWTLRGEHVGTSSTNGRTLG